jgi:hypothetical protein
MIIKRKGIQALDKKNISISLGDEIQHIILQSFSNFHKKSNKINETIFIEVVKTNKDFERKLSDDILFKLDIEKDANFSNKTQNKITKTIEKILQTNMSESLTQKMVALKKEINLIKKEGNFDFSFKVNSEYLPKAPEPKKPAYSKNNNNNNKNQSKESFSDKFKRIPVVYVLDKLVDLGVITLERACKPNGNETFYWIDMPDNSSSKVTVLSRKSVESGSVGKKFGMARDVKQSKLNATSAYGFMSRLEQEGVLGDKKAYDVIQEVLKEDGKITFKNFPLVDIKGGKIDMGDNGEFISIVNLELPSRMPVVYYMAKKTEEYKKYLTDIRTIDSDIIEREFKNKNISTGNFFSCINYTKYSLGLFKLGYLDENRSRSKTYEMVSFDRNNKLEKGHLKNIKIKGRSHIIPSEKPKSTIFTEAVIDNYSLENIFRLANNINEKDYQYVGLTSVGNIQGWLEYNLNIKMFFKDPAEGEELKLQASYIQKKVEEIENQEEAKLKLGDALKKKRLHFIVDETQDWCKKEGNQAFYRLSNTLKEIDKDIEVNKICLTDPKNRKVDLKDFSNGEGCDDYILDATNINEFLKENNIKTTYMPEKKYDVVITKNVEKLIPISEATPEILKAVRDRYVKITRTESMTFAFDNDIAALPKLPHLKKFCELLNLETCFIIPTFKHGINDNNDVLKTYRTMVQGNKIKEANELVEQFSSQLHIKNKLPDNFKEIVAHAKKLDIVKAEEKRQKKKKPSF